MVALSRLGLAPLPVRLSGVAVGRAQRPLQLQLQLKLQLKLQLQLPLT